MKHTITQQINGVTVRVKGETYVFNDPYEFGKFIGSLYHFGEPRSYTVTLVFVGERPINAIKLIRDETGQGIVESKKIVDKVREGRPQVIKDFDNIAQAQAFALKFEEQGFGVTCK
jgi:hypothetical protein